MAALSVSGVEAVLARRAVARGRYRSQAPQRDGLLASFTGSEAPGFKSRLCCVDLIQLLSSPTLETRQQIAHRARGRILCNLARLVSGQRLQVCVGDRDGSCEIPTSPGQPVYRRTHLAGNRGKPAATVDQRLLEGVALSLADRLLQGSAVLRDLAHR